MTEQDPERTALEKFEQFLDDQKCAEIFTADEAAALRRVAKIIITIDALGSFGNWVKSILIWLGVIIAAWIGFKNGLAEWLRALVS